MSQAFLSSAVALFSVNSSELSTHVLHNWTNDYVLCLVFKHPLSGHGKSLYSLGDLA